LPLILTLAQNHKPNPDPNPNHNLVIDVSRYVGVDIAIDSLKHFVDERLITASVDVVQRKKISHLVSADMGKDSLTSTLLETHTWIPNPNGGEIESKWDSRLFSIAVFSNCLINLFIIYILFLYLLLCFISIIYNAN
jgi:hypothetical protein